MIKIILALTVVMTLAGLAIGVTNIHMKDRIEARELEVQQSAISSVFPEGLKIREMRDSGGILPETYWTAFSDDDKLTAYAFKMSGRGYAGNIQFMVGMGVDGNILGITVFDNHKETPGLGSRVNEIASTRYIWNPTGGDENAKPWFTEQFEGLSSLKPIAVNKNIGEWHGLDKAARDDLRNKNAVTAITGSTITTVAFTRAIEEKAKAYLHELGGYCCPATKKKKEAEAQASSTESDGGDKPALEEVPDSAATPPKVSSGATGPRKASTGEKREKIR